MAAEEKVTFPVPGYCSIFSSGKSFADRYRPIDPAMVVGLLCVMARSAHVPAAPQVLEQSLFQRASSLDIKATVDRFVRQMKVLVTRVCLL